MDDEKRMTIRIDAELHKAARLRALEEDITLSDVVRQFIRAWLRGELPTPPAEKEEEIEPF